LPSYVCFVQSLSPLTPLPSFTGTGELINVLREAGQTVPEELLKFGTTVKKKEHKL